ncbi:hypothetical protein Ahy_A07g036920 [Arachis hypogaea]|uniref:Uncharacterized protein n=1 Tax=Arachis hypogaea TaxID=3818 RepID=A0A445CHC2_ARAHY|nr:hypothetical protein Ahy_A07g036920 [Arachis hypogaea]
MSTRSDPVPEATAAALLMMARIASYVPRECPLSSFSLGFTDSSQEETQSQEGQGQPKSQIVTAMCLILNQENIKRFQEEIYCLPPNIVNMAIGNHLDGKFLQPKSKKPFKVEDYPMLIPFLDLTKLASHPYYGHASDFCTCLLFKALVVMGELGYMLGEHLSRKEIVKLNLHKLTFQANKHHMIPKNVKNGKYEWDNWTQAEVGHFKVEFGSQILFHVMNCDRDTAIRGNEEMRLSKPSAVLLSPYCQVNSYDMESEND